MEDCSKPVPGEESEKDVYASALEKALDCLDFGELTELGLVRKLRTKGFSKETAEEAAAHLTEIGVLDDRAFADRAVRFYLERKCYGKSRIVTELLKKGVKKADIAEALGEIDEDEWDQACETRVRSMFGRKLPLDLTEKKRAIGSMMRYGFSASQTLAALKICEEE